MKTKVNVQDLIKILSQIPFQYLKKENVEAEKIKETVFEPIHIVLSSLHIEKDLPLLLFFTKIILVIVEQYPELLMDAVIIFTRSKPPLHLLGVTSFLLYPWDHVDVDTALKVIHEIYLPINNMNEQEKSMKMNIFISENLILSQEYLQKIYKAEPRLMVLNDNLYFPLINVISKIFSIFIKKEHTEGILLYCMEILFGFCYKSGSLNPKNLNHITRLRMESIEVMKKLLNEEPRAARYFLIFLRENILFLLSTQPRLFDSIFPFIQSLDLSKWVLEQDDFQVIEKLFLPFYNSNVRGAKETSENVAKTILELISWKEQTQTIKIKTLDLLIKNTLLQTDLTSWILLFMTSKFGFELTNVTPSKELDEFLEKINGSKYEIPLSVGILITLSNFEFEIQKILSKERELLVSFDEDFKTETPYGEALKYFKKKETEMGILEKIKILGGTSGQFVISIMAKYLTILSHFQLNDTKSTLDQISAVIANFIKMKDMENLFPKNANDEIFSTWVYLFLRVSNSLLTLVFIKSKLCNIFK